MGYIILALALEDLESCRWFKEMIEKDINFEAYPILRKYAIRQELDKLFKWHIDAAQALIQLKEEGKIQINENKSTVLESTEYPIKTMQNLLNQHNKEAAQTEICLELLHNILNAINQHPGCRSVIEYSMLETNNNSSIGYSVNEYLNSKEIPTSNSELNAISKRASHFYLLGKERVPIRIKHKNTYFGNEIIYVKLAVNSVLYP
jgi:hypothetical protein